MRRKLAVVPKTKQRALVYTSCILALLAYGVPKLPALHEGISGTFSALWILFAALAVAANVYFLVGADKERSRMLEVKDVLPTGLSAKEMDSLRQRAYGR